MDQDATGTKVGLGLRDIVSDGDPALPPLKGHSPQFSANVRRGQRAGWTKMPLCMEVGLGPGEPKTGFDLPKPNIGFGQRHPVLRSSFIELKQ